MDRAELVDFVTDLVRIYVVEGGTPFSVEPIPRTTAAVPQSGGGFAQVIAELKTRFDWPELGQFRVEGDRVSVTIGDQTIPLGASPARRRTPPERASGPEASPRRDVPRRDAPSPAASRERSRYLELD